MWHNRHGVWQCPPFRAEPSEAEKKERKTCIYMQKEMEREIWKRFRKFKKEVRKCYKSVQVWKRKKGKKEKSPGCNSKGMGNRDANITPTQHSTTPPAPHPKLPKLDPTHSGGACPPWDLLQVMIPYHRGAGLLDAPECPSWDLPWVYIH